MNPETEKTVLILGLGNLLFTDEGVGVHVAQRLLQMKLPAEVAVIDGGTGGYELIEHVRGKSKVVIIDCLNANAPPGSIVRLSLEELALRQPHPFSAHQGGVGEFLAFLKTLVPAPEVVVYGVVPDIVDQLGMELSPAVETQFSKIVSTIIDELSAKTAAPPA